MLSLLDGYQHSTCISLVNMDSIFNMFSSIINRVLAAATYITSFVVCILCFSNSKTVTFSFCIQH